MKRNYVVDLIRIIAIFAVVGVHTFGTSLSQGIYDIIRYQPTFYIERIFRFGVPLFFIISGYVLALRYSKPFSLVQFWKRRAVRLLPPYILWSAFYMLLADKFHFSGFVTGEFVGKLLTGSAGIHLYFIPALFLLYMIFPFVQRAMRFLNAYTFILFTVVEFVLLTLDYSSVWRIPNDVVRIAVLNLYVFVVGMITFLHQEEVLSFVKKYKYFLLISLLVSIFIICRQTFLLLLSTKTLEYINSQWETVLFLYAILLWFLLFGLPQKIVTKYSKQITFFSKISFFVFFIHVFIISTYWRIIGSYLFNKTGGAILDQVWYTPMVYLIVLTISYAIGFFVSKIPKISWLVGIE